MDKWKLIVLLLLGFTSTAPTLWGKFIFDDGEAIVKNSDVTDPSPRGFHNIWKNDFWGVRLTHKQSHKSFRPLTTLTFRWNYQWNRKPWTFHIINSVIHSINCVLVYYFLLKCLGWSPKYQQVCFWAAIVFAVHPVHVEPLGTLVGRADLLSALVFLGGYILCPDKIGLKSSIFIAFVSILGSLFKENAIIAALLYAALDVIVRKRLKPKRREIVFHAISVGLIAAFVGWRLWYQKGPPVFQPYDNPPAFAKKRFSRMLSIMYVWLLNGVLLVNPTWLCYDWSMGCIELVKSPLDPRFYAILLAFLVGLRLLWVAFYSRVVMTSVLIGGVTFLPSSNLLFTVGFVLAERNLYLPSIGFALLLSFAVQKRGSLTLLGVIVMWFYLKSVHRSVAWINEVDLFTTALQVCPNNAKVHYNLGAHHGERGRKYTALKYYTTALELRPDYYQAMNNLGNLLRTMEKYDEAEKWLRKAVATRSDFAAAWMNLGIVVSQSNATEAMSCYLQALRYRKIYPDCEYNLGNLYLELGDKENALRSWKKAVSRKPTHSQAWVNIIIFFDQEGRLEEARDWAIKAIKIIPNNDTVYFLLGNIAGKLKDFTIAEKYFKSAIRLRQAGNKSVPAKYFANLGVLYHRWNKKDLARIAYEESLKIDPSNQSIRKHISNLN